MEKYIASELTYGIFRHPAIFTEGNDEVFKFLCSVDAPRTSEFCRELPENVFIKTDFGKDYFLYLRRILRNKNAQLTPPTLMGRAYEGLASSIRVRDSEILIRKVTQDRNLVSIIRKCDAPFSIFGFFETCEDKTLTKPELTKIRPVLFVPGTGDSSKREELRKILEWEQKNMNYEARREGLGFLSFPKRISKEKYLSY